MSLPKRTDRDAFKHISEHERPRRRRATKSTTPDSLDNDEVFEPPRDYLAALLAFIPDEFTNCYCLCLAVTIMSALVSLYVADVEPDPYVDEIFHVPQAQNYCQGNFQHWDAKITTLPALYYVSFVMLKPVCWAVGLEPCCTVLQLRMVNVVFCGWNVALIWTLVHSLHPHMPPLERFMTVLNIACFPTLLFFAFLYYTEQVSTFFLLAMLLATRLRQRTSTLFCSLLAVATRQSNIVWVAFAGSLWLQEPLLRWLALVSDDAESESYRHRSSVGEEARQLLNAFRRKQLSTRRWPLDLARVILASCWHFLLVGVAFVAFVVGNGGIVVGDRSAHRAVLHVPQLFYFCASCCAFSVTYQLYVLWHYHSWLWRRWLTRSRVGAFLLASLVVAALMWKTSYAHPYLLADNRHLSHVIWRRFLSRVWLRCALAPVWCGSALLVLAALRHRGLLFLVAFSGATALVLIPQEMLEFRYFIAPFVFWRLYRRPFPHAEGWLLLIELVCTVGVNLAALIAFGYLPIRQGWEGKEQHFMW